MNEAAEAGFSFASVMGGSSAFGGKEVIVVMVKDLKTAPAKRRYKLLATSKTSTMQKELQEAGDEGFLFKGQTVFTSLIGGREVSVILERDSSKSEKIDYRLLATTKTSTMQKELREAGEQGYEVLGMTVNATAFGGSEVVCILAKR